MKVSMVKILNITCSSTPDSGVSRVLRESRMQILYSNRREIADAATLYLSLKTREARGRI